MTDKEVIRAEIEKLRKEYDIDTTPIAKYQIAQAILNRLSDVIGSLQKEPVSIWHDGCEIPKSGTNILMIRKDEEDPDYPPIAGCFHGTNFRLDGKNWGYYNGFCYNEIEPPVKWIYIDDILNLSKYKR